MCIRSDLWSSELHDEDLKSQQFGKAKQCVGFEFDGFSSNATNDGFVHFHEFDEGSWPVARDIVHSNSNASAFASTHFDEQVHGSQP